MENNTHTPAPTLQQAPSFMSRLWGTGRQFLRFGLVGGSGVLVNLLVFYLARKMGLELGIQPEDTIMNLFGTRFNLKAYHVYSTLAFLIANIYNFQLNRLWTFKGSQKRAWLPQFISFLMIGSVAFGVQMVVTTALMNLNSPVSLPRDIFDGSSGLRSPEYWAQAIGVMIAMPVNFLFNKLITFRGKHKEETPAAEASPELRAQGEATDLHQGAGTAPYVQDAEVSASS